MKKILHSNLFIFAYYLLFLIFVAKLGAIWLKRFGHINEVSIPIILLLFVVMVILFRLNAFYKMINSLETTRIGKNGKEYYFNGNIYLFLTVSIDFLYFLYRFFLQMN